MTQEGSFLQKSPLLERLLLKGTRNEVVNTHSVELLVFLFLIFISIF